MKVELFIFVDTKVSILRGVEISSLESFVNTFETKDSVNFHFSGDRKLLIMTFDWGRFEVRELLEDEV